MIFSLIQLYLFSLLHPLTSGKLINVTIDDSSPDPRTAKQIIYNPPKLWNSEGLCQPGPGKCSAQPDRGSMHDGTWHEATFFPELPSPPLTASVQFDGTAVYVFCALALTVSKPTGQSDMSFFIDGQIVGTFSRPALGTPGYLYDVPVYANTSLPYGPHEIQIMSGRLGEVPSITIIDRIVYSIDDDYHPPPPVTASDHTSSSTSISTSTPSSSSGTTTDHTSSSTSISLSTLSSSSDISISSIASNEPLATTSSHQDDGPSSARDSLRSTSPGTIIGAVIGSLAAIAILIALFFLSHKNRWLRSTKDIPNKPHRTTAADYPSGDGFVVASDSKRALIALAELPPAYIRTQRFHQE